MPIIDLIMPALNEQNAVGLVIQEIPKGLIRHVIVVDNGSTDNTKVVAQQNGAVVLHENRKGYGFACLKGIEYLQSTKPTPDIVVFIDADHSDYPERMDEMINIMCANQLDLIIGSRSLGKLQKGAMTFPQIFGNWLATTLIKIIYDVRFTDLGPFRAIRYNQLMKLGMQDQTYGWTVEMQVKAAKSKMKVGEIAVDYRTRIGISKISGTIRGTILAGYKIIFTIFKYR